MNIENWLSTELGIKIWENKYRYNNESLEQWFNRVSGNNKDIKQLIKDHKFLFGGRTLNNRGLNNGSGLDVSAWVCTVIAQSGASPAAKASPVLRVRSSTSAIIAT